MNKNVRSWLIAATLFVVIGLGAIFALLAFFAGWDFLKLSNVIYDDNVYEISEEFANISINTDTADIVFVQSKDGKCKVVCHEKKNMKHSVEAMDGNLSINLVDTRKWYEYISWFEFSKITVYLPKEEYASLLIDENTGDVEISNSFKFESICVSVSTGDIKCFASAEDLIKISTSTGDISVENISTASLDLSVSTGDIKITNVNCTDGISACISSGDTSASNVKCSSFVSTGTTGDISLNSVIATGGFNIERSTGDVKFDKSDASEVFVKTSTGDVNGSFLSNKIFVTSTSTGNIDVPKSTSGGVCEINTSTGDIKISIVN